MSEENVEICAARSRRGRSRRRGDAGVIRARRSRRLVEFQGMDAHVVRGHGELRTMVEAPSGLRTFRSEHDVRGEIGRGCAAENTAYLRGRDGVRVEARSAWLINLQDGR